jgi:hypothetical protein
MKQSMRRRRALAQLAQLLTGRSPKNPDWRAILALAGEQLLTPQLYNRLDALRSGVPADVLSYVGEAHRRTRARNVRLSQTLADALTALNAAGVEPVLLKGCALWARTPPPACDRLISDLDLLVKPQEMQAAIDALVSAGFGVLGDDRLTRDHDVVVLGRPADVGAIDLHQRPPGPRGAVEISDADLRSVRLEGGAAKVLSPELQILTAAIHDQLHDAHFWRGGFDIRRLLDIAVIAEGSVDWARLAARCKTPQIGAALTAQLEAAHRIAAADIPEGMRAGFWGRIHFWRQHAQFAWPWTNTVFDVIRGVRGAAQVQRSLSAWLARRTAERMYAPRLGDQRRPASSAISTRQCVRPL